MRRPGRLLGRVALSALLCTVLSTQARAGGCFHSWGAFLGCVADAFGIGGGSGNGNNGNNNGQQHNGTGGNNGNGNGNGNAGGTDNGGGGSGSDTSGGSGSSGSSGSSGGPTAPPAGPPPGMDDLGVQGQSGSDSSGSSDKGKGGAGGDTMDLVKPNLNNGLPPPPDDNGLTSTSDGGTPGTGLSALGPVGRKTVADYVAMAKTNDKPKSTGGALKGMTGALDEMLREGPGDAQHGAGSDPSGRATGSGSAAASARADAASQNMTFHNLMNSARSKMKAKDYRGALEDINALLRADPSNIEALARRAHILNQLKLYTQAEKDARDVIARDPNNAEAWQQLAWSLLKQKRFKEALEAAERAVALNPNAVNFAIRSYIKEAMGDHAGALADLERAALLDPRYRDRLAMAKQGGKIYDPDADDEDAGDMVAGARSGRLPKWPAAAALLALVILSIGGAVGLRRGRSTGPSTGPAPTMIAERPTAPMFKAESGGKMVGKYELGQVIGQGGMGQVFEAKDLSLGRRVAVKKLSEKMSELGAQGKQMMIQEARLVAALHHPSIVDIYEIIEQDDSLYLVFEFVSGKTLNHIIAESGGKLPFDKAAMVLKPICDALEFAHSQNLVHRDLKPSNIMVTEQGYVKLMDFGVARSLNDTAPAPQAGVPPQNAQLFARTQTVVGTPSYMPPEAGEGIVSKQVDVYALGVTLYEILTGRLPFGVETTTIDKRAMQYPPASSLVWGVPPAVDDLIRQALDPEPTRRIQSPAQFLSMLETAAAGFQAPAA